MIKQKHELVGCNRVPYVGETCYYKVPVTSWDELYDYCQANGLKGAVIYNGDYCFTTFEEYTG